MSSFWKKLAHMQLLQNFCRTQSRQRTDYSFHPACLVVRMHLTPSRQEVKISNQAKKNNDDEDGSPKKFMMLFVLYPSLHSIYWNFCLFAGTRTNADKKQQKTSKSSKCSASSARWWLVFGLIYLLYLNGATVLGP